jgi:hypothetical protein
MGPYTRESIALTRTRRNLKRRTLKLYLRKIKQFSSEHDFLQCNTNGLKRRNTENNEYGILTDFVLSIVNKLEKNEEQVKRLVIAKDEILMNVWESLMYSLFDFFALLKIFH